MTPTLYLIRGLPGCGKSTLAKSLCAANIVQFVFEADQYFTSINGDYNFDANKLGAAHKVCQESTMQWLSKGYSVAVSNTSTTEKEVETYKKIADANNANFVSLVVEHRHEGVNQHNVPAEKILQMQNRFSIKL